MPSAATTIDPLDQPVYHTAHRLSLAGFAATGFIATPARADPGVPAIWDPGILASRRRFQVPLPSRPMLGAFVPFTFATRTPAAMAVATGYKGMAKIANSDLVILRSTTRRVLDHLMAVVVVDRMPLNRDAVFQAGPAALHKLDWAFLAGGYFKRSASDPTIVPRAGAELLVHGDVYAEALDAIICWSGKSEVEMVLRGSSGHNLQVIEDHGAVFDQGG